MRERPHVTLRQPRGGRHGVTVGQQQPAVSTLGNRDDFGEPFTLDKDVLCFTNAPKCTADDEIAWQDHAHGNGRSCGEERDRCVASGYGETFIGRTRTQIQRHDGQRGCAREDRGARLNAEPRKKQESGCDRSDNSADRVCEVEATRRRATSDSACCTSALARGKLTPIRIEGTPASNSSGLTSNQISVSGDAAPVATPTAASSGLAVARRSPATALTANSACASINHLAACGVRLARMPPAYAPMAMPVNTTVNSSAKTARNPPSRTVAWRNQRISMPSAANPVRASAALARTMVDGV